MAVATALDALTLPLADDGGGDVVPWATALDALTLPLAGGGGAPSATARDALTLPLADGASDGGGASGAMAFDASLIDIAVAAEAAVPTAAAGIATADGNCERGCTGPFSSFLYVPGPRAVRHGGHGDWRPFLGPPIRQTGCAGGGLRRKVAGAADSAGRGGCIGCGMHWARGWRSGIKPASDSDEKRQTAAVPALTELANAAAGAAAAGDAAAGQLRRNAPRPTRETVGSVLHEELVRIAVAAIGYLQDAVMSAPGDGHREYHLVSMPSLLATAAAAGDCHLLLHTRRRYAVGSSLHGEEADIGGLYVEVLFRRGVAAGRYSCVVAARRVACNG